ncbi:cytochrome c biogenesis CcdA family protein [Microbacterium elymi]|uniref:Cytochrome c biogenesis protein CcdA n=1 Tax=Microbacterium elymi TaxID=2909587 RepID=A0ABY5NI87_9MICO|nr:MULTISPECIES: cytochrome c biogenesis protein CcdA [Microbacterium]UUT34811.1 cytochrome c biogenesis protein CcdA [Microbacterium elymi]
MTDLVAGGALWIAIPIAVLAGLVSFLSPCVLPLVPGYLGFIGGAVAPRRGATGTASADVRPARGRLVGGVLLFIAGFTVVFMAMNILGGSVGLFFLTYRDVITRVMGVVIILLGLVFIGLFGFAQRTFKPEIRGNLGLVGAPLLGLALGVGWAPCIGPTLTVILGMSLDSASASRGAVLGLAYSLGLGIPFLLIALGFGWATRSVAFLRRHIRTVNLVGGAVLIVLGVLMVTGVWGVLMSQLQGVIAGVTPAL